MIVVIYPWVSHYIRLHFSTLPATSKNFLNLTNIADIPLITWPPPSHLGMAIRLLANDLALVWSSVSIGHSPARLTSSTDGEETMISVVNRPVRRQSPAVRPRYLQDGRDGAKAVRPVIGRHPPSPADIGRLLLIHIQ